MLVGVSLWVSGVSLYVGGDASTYWWGGSLHISGGVYVCWWGCLCMLVGASLWVSGGASMC